MIFVVIEPDVGHKSWSLQISKHSFSSSFSLSHSAFSFLLFSSNHYPGVSVQCSVFSFQFDSFNIDYIFQESITNSCQESSRVWFHHRSTTSIRYFGHWSLTHPHSQSEIILLWRWKKDIRRGSVVKKSGDERQNAKRNNNNTPGRREEWIITTMPMKTINILRKKNNKHMVKVTINQYGERRERERERGWEGKR